MSCFNVITNNQIRLSNVFELSYINGHHVTNRLGIASLKMLPNQDAHELPPPMSHDQLRAMPQTVVEKYHTMSDELATLIPPKPSLKTRAENSRDFIDEGYPGLLGFILSLMILFFNLGVALTRLVCSGSKYNSQTRVSYCSDDVELGLEVATGSAELVNTIAAFLVFGIVSWVSAPAKGVAQYNPA